tara:strand:- start:132 stop:461 length:330 start_codon:yes stop_codon:yes gene_type:complete
MAITYTWSIVDMERQITMGDKSDVITEIRYQLDGTETVGGKEHTGSMDETVKVELGSKTFKAFSDVKEADAIQWVKEKLGQDGIANSELNVSNQISESQTPITATGVSW